MENSSSNNNMVSSLYTQICEREFVVVVSLGIIKSLKSYNLTCYYYFRSLSRHMCEASLYMCVCFSLDDDSVFNHSVVVSCQLYGC